MSGFKDMISRDISKVFLNPDEFAELHIVNGREMAVSLDDIENIEREKRVESHMDGVYAHQKYLSVAAVDFGPLPAQNDIVTIDRKRYKVIDASNECGMYMITLESNRSGR